MVLNNSRTSRFRLLIVACCIPLAAGALSAQDLNVTTTTMHDENIFEVYNPTSDQLTEINLDCSKDWDYDNSNIGLAYTGGLQLFHDLPQRNYHVHSLSLSSFYHFERESDDEENDDSSAANGEGAGEGLAAHRDSPGTGSGHGPAVSPDSSDNFVFASAWGTLQVDKDGYQNYDNSRLGASAALRQPIGAAVSAWPAYAFVYRNYPNVSALSNVQNILSFSLGTSLVGGGWISVSPAYSFKSYTGSSTYYDTLIPPGLRVSHGNGKGIGGGAGSGGAPRGKKYTFTTPSVRQFSVAGNWRQKVGGSTELGVQYVFFGEPSSEARLLSNQLQGAPGSQGPLVDMGAQNEISDDHFAYSGNEAAFSARQAIPGGIVVGIGQSLQSKTYTVPALNLDDSTIVAPHREDRRYETQISLSKSFPIGSGRTLRPQAQIEFIRNSSNAPFYVFNKTTFLAGLELNF